MSGDLLGDIYGDAPRADPKKDDHREPFGARFESADVSEFDGRVARALVAANVRRKGVEWLDVEGMRGRIAKGSVNLLVGDPGLGKSLLSLDIAAGVSRNGGFVLVATAEDSLEATVRPRLDAAGANLDRIAFVEMYADGFPDGLRIPDDVAELERLVVECGASLVIVDPLMAHLPGEINSWRDQSIRLALAPLHGLADRQGCAALVLAHLNKSARPMAPPSPAGSVGITGAARSVLLMARDPDDSDGEKGRRRVLAHAKCNVGPEMPSLIYEIEPILVPASAEDPEVETARIVQIGQSDHDAEHLLAGRGDPEERSALGEAVAFLEEEIGDRVIDAKAVQRAARDAGISEPTLKRAKDRAGVLSQRVGGVGDAGHWTWRLRGSRGLDSSEDQEVGLLSANPHEEQDSASDESLRGSNEDIEPLGDEIDLGTALDEIEAEIDYFAEVVPKAIREHKEELRRGTLARGSRRRRSEPGSRPQSISLPAKKSGVNRPRTGSSVGCSTLGPATRCFPPCSTLPRRRGTSPRPSTRRGWRCTRRWNAERAAPHRTRARRVSRPFPRHRARPLRAGRPARLPTLR